jgi:hypothetical protein
MNTTTEKSDAIFTDLVAGLERLRENRGATTEAEPAPKAFTGNDSSVYLSQAMAVADLLGTVDHTQCAKGTVNEAGMLVFALLDAARELDEIEREERRARAGKLPEARS